MQTDPGGAPRRGPGPPERRVIAAISAPDLPPTCGCEERMRDVVIHVCTTCKREGDDPALPRPGAELAQALAQRPAPCMRVTPVACLGNCKRSCSVALSAPGCWTYVFGDLGPGSAQDVLAAAALLQTSTDGLMAWRGRPEPFKRGMIARIPPLEPLQDAAE